MMMRRWMIALLALAVASCGPAAPRTPPGGPPKLPLLPRRGGAADMAEKYTYVDGALLLEEIIEDETGDLLNLTLRLRSTGAAAGTFDYRVVFLNEKGEFVAGSVDDWESFYVPSREADMLEGASLVPGARNAVLLVRAHGGSDNGLPDQAKKAGVAPPPLPPSRSGVKPPPPPPRR